MRVKFPQILGKEIDFVGLLKLENLHVALEDGTEIVKGVDLEVDVRASDELIAEIPSEVVGVSESGLRTPTDLARLRALGYRAFLIEARLRTSEGQPYRLSTEARVVPDGAPSNAAR